MPKRIIGNPTTTPMAMPDIDGKIESKMSRLVDVIGNKDDLTIGENIVEAINLVKATVPYINRGVVSLVPPTLTDNFIAISTNGGNTYNVYTKGYTDVLLQGLTADINVLEDRVFQTPITTIPTTLS